MIITLQDFKGMVPKIDDHLLDEQHAVFSENVDLKSGALIPYRSRLFIQSLTEPTAQSIYFYRGGTNFIWLEWLDEGINVAESTIAGEIFDRIYFSGASHFQSFGRIADPDVRPKVFANWEKAGGSHPDGSIEGDLILGCPGPIRAPDTEVSQLTIDQKWTRSWFSFWERQDTGEQDQFTDLIEGTDVIEQEPGKLYNVNKTNIPGLFTPPDADTNWIFIVGTIGFSNFVDEGDVGTNLGTVYAARSAKSTINDLVIKNSTVSESLTYNFDGPDLDNVDVKFTYNYPAELQSRFSNDRFYVYTFVNLFGEESSPSDPSVLTTVDLTQNASLSGLGSYLGGSIYVVGDTVLIGVNPFECIETHLAPPSIDDSKFIELLTQINFKRVYRTVYSDTGVEFKLVAEINSTQNSFVDELEDKDTSDVLTTQIFDMPPKEMEGLTSLGTFLAGFSNKDNAHTVHFSVENRPHAWPSTFDITVDAKIIGINKIGNSLVAMTDEGPVEFRGYRPQSMQQVRSPIRQSLTNRLASTQGEGFMYWASPDGICMMSPGGGVRIITDNYYLKEQWQALEPENMKFFLYDRRLMISTSSNIPNLIFNLDDRRSAFTNFEQDWFIAGGRYNEFEDAFFFIDDQSIYQWNVGRKNLTMTWQSKDFRLSQPVQWTCARIWADDYNEILTLNIYADGNLATTVNFGDTSIDNDQIIRLPKTRKSKNWSFEIVSNTTVHKVVIGQSVQDMRGA